MAELDELVAAVVPYVTAVAGAYGHKVFQQVKNDGADAAAEATVGVGRRLLRRLLGSAQAAQIEGAVTDVVDSPGDSDCEAALRVQVKKAVTADSGLAGELREMLSHAGVAVLAAGERSIAAHTISGIAVTGDDAQIQR